jgi:alcohol dehydrogenase class IV
VSQPTTNQDDRVTWAYEFLAPAKIVFGWGRRSEIGGLAAQLGKRAFLIQGSRTLADNGTLAEILSHLTAAGVEVVEAGASRREPTVEDVDHATAAIREQGPRPGDLVLAIGGGSAIDLGKAVAAMAVQPGDHSVREYLEGVGSGLKLTATPLPLVAMPTTAGTGTEATKNAVISGGDPPFKKSLRSEQMIPRVALVDPELTLHLPPNVTAHTGLDALTQLIESYITRQPQPLPQAMARAALAGLPGALRTAFHDGFDREAREKLSHAALVSGLALANSGLGFAHGVAAALGVHANVPHGLACAVMLPVAMRLNRDLRIAELASLAAPLTGRGASSIAAAADAAIEAIDHLCDDLAIPRKLSALGVTREQLPQLVTASRGNSMSCNPRELLDDELGELLEGIL